jgi:toxin YoeB
VNIEFTPEGWDHHVYWQKNDKNIVKRLNRLIEAAQRDPYNGIGDPEPLKYNYSGLWSRRITEEHRLVYKATETTLYIISCRYHYLPN